MNKIQASVILKTRQMLFKIDMFNGKLNVIFIFFCIVVHNYKSMCSLMQIKTHFQVDSPKRYTKGKRRDSLCSRLVELQGIHVIDIGELAVPEAGSSVEVDRKPVEPLPLCHATDKAKR